MKEENKVSIGSCVLDEPRKVDRNQSMQDCGSHVKDFCFYPKRSGNLLIGFMQKTDMLIFVCWKAHSGCYMKNELEKGRVDTDLIIWELQYFVCTNS